MLNDSLTMNQLILWSDVVLFSGTNPRATTEHSHPVIQLVIALKEDFLSKTQDGEWENKKGLLIAPNHYHECDASHVPILSISLDPDSAFGEQILINHLNKVSVVEYPSENLGRIDTDKLSNSILTGDLSLARQIIEMAFQYSPTNNLKGIDKRIHRIREYIQSNINTELNTQTLMDVVHLSESRLLHLFKSELGLPIRNYILWYRLQVALKLVIKGHSLTAAAHQAGFSDQSHMTRTCVKMLGIPPSIITKNSKFIQVSFSE